jgi:hypothetical protein
LLAPDREREQTVQERQVVSDGLRRQSLVLLGQQVRLDARPVDLVHRPAAEERAEVGG